MIYQQAMLTQEGCDFERTLEILDKAKGVAKTLGENARVAQMRGSCLGHLKRYEEAKEAFKVNNFYHLLNI